MMPTDHAHRRRTPGTVLGMDDREIAAALAADHHSGLAMLYDAYANRLYDYCRGMLRDDSVAGDALHDTLLLAVDRIAQLRDPNRLRPWLYAIARNECLRLAKNQRRHTALEEIPEPSDPSVDLDRTVAAEQARHLVTTAAASLSAREQEVLALSLRHDLGNAGVGAVLGVSDNHAAALVSRARDALERAVTALATVQTGRAECAQLSAIVGAWDGTFDSVRRKRVSRHIVDCPTCGAHSRSRARAAAMFSAVPFGALPLVWRDRALAAAAQPDKIATVSHRTEPFDDAGFPVPLDRATGRTALPWAVVTAIAALLLGAIVVGGANAQVGAVGRFADAGGIATSSPPVISAERSAAPTVSLEATPTVTANPTVARPGAPPPPSRPTPATPSVSPRTAPVTVTGSATDVSATPCGPWSAAITGVVMNGTASSVVAEWSGPDGARNSVPLTAVSTAADGWRGRFDRLPAGTTTWQLTATVRGTPNLQPIRSPTYTITHQRCID